MGVNQERIKMFNKEIFELPITIEGATYKFNGTVSDVVVMDEHQG